MCLVYLKIDCMLLTLVEIQHQIWILTTSAKKFGNKLGENALYDIRLLNSLE